MRSGVTYGAAGDYIHKVHSHSLTFRKQTPFSDRGRYVGWRRTRGLRSETSLLTAQ